MINANLSRKLEISANVAVLLIAILIGGIVAMRFAAPTKSPRPSTEMQGALVGKVIKLDSINWSASDKTLVLAISTKCKFCTESMPFYRQLLAERAKSDLLRIVAVLPQPVEEARDLFESNGLRFDSVASARLDSISVGGTPTLLLTDREGAVIDSWVGKLTPERESEVFRAVFGDR